MPAPRDRPLWRPLTTVGVLSVQHLYLGRLQSALNTEAPV